MLSLNILRTNILIKEEKEEKENHALTTITLDFFSFFQKKYIYIKDKTNDDQPYF
jgi:hypothetical protein